MSKDHHGNQVDEAYDSGLITEVLRPAAVVPEETARSILIELSLNSVHADGVWFAEPSRWNRYDKPWTLLDAPGDAGLIGTIQVAYGTPRRYDITIYRVSVTTLGSELGWSVQSLTDDALGLAGLTLAECPRTVLDVPPKPYRY
ncbi:MAG: hypothetical protein GXX79_15545 [Actinomycetales bacterium]|nr:hypothetical protein [Actinomycetales bacterium]